ncbi:hypothetical protein BU23DRAFT_579966 [Bimuria novae-zelandiae CBS 107.79]|uniref:Uncharacterized protein n=1 Tax=Bimuria novae-zelandiae CBS 107.79 TaxID=1447943 RepID=A0A6A5VA28_9PLEO|nr:hypothetical protein BU23DRAFT_579966 [Bimuria novae-zelandiae CBS 107.79]
MALAPMLTNLKRTILAHLPTKLAPRYPEGTLLHVIKPLYGIAEAGVHWWTTYYRHYCKELDMSTLIYNLCLLVTNSNADDFGIMENLNRGLRYIPVNLIDAKLIVFVDGSFANNKDLSSQLGFILMLINESTDVDNAFIICGNVIHYSLTKCKRVTRSVLASKIYGIIITERLSLPAVPLVVCTDSYSLYECLVKLGTTKEKRLIIDIMALRQSYERREITEI